MNTKSLYDVTNGLSFGTSQQDTINTFLNSVYLSKSNERYAMIVREPRLFKDLRLNIYIAGIAEHLALKYDLHIPDWVSRHARCSRATPAATNIHTNLVTLRHRSLFIVSF